MQAAIVDGMFESLRIGFGFLWTAALVSPMAARRTTSVQNAARSRSRNVRLISQTYTHKFLKEVRLAAMTTNRIPPQRINERQQSVSPHLLAFRVHPLTSGTRCPSEFTAGVTERDR